MMGYQLKTAILLVLFYYLQPAVGLCPALPKLKHGSLTYDPERLGAGEEYATGDTVTYKCSRKYTLDRPDQKTRTCRKKGRGWSGEDASCIEIEDVQLEDELIEQPSKKLYCSSNPCPKKATCYERESGKGYRCECPEGFRAENCEKSRPSTKKGLAMSLSNLLSCDDFRVFKSVTWWYDWTSDAKRLYREMEKKNIKCSKEDMASLGERVPMIYRLDVNKGVDETIDDYVKALKDRDRVKTSHCLAGFNEPNHEGEGRMHPILAAFEWRKKVLPIAKLSHFEDCLITPAASICGKNPEYCNTQVLAWFDLFIDFCPGCQFKAMATHYFGCDVDEVMGYIDVIYNRYHRDIWLTEIACPHEKDPDVIMDFLLKLLPRLENHKHVIRYAYYSFRLTEDLYITKAASLLHQTNSKLTDSGKVYDQYEPAI